MFLGRFIFVSYYSERKRRTEDKIAKLNGLDIAEKESGEISVAHRMHYEFWIISQNSLRLGVVELH